MKDKSDHIPSLDGIRGVAILLVLLVHFIPPVAMQWRLAEWFMKVFSTGGWIGVDLFFVLSGFLITGILLRSKDKPRYFINFYMRRTLRIVPVYFLALLIVFGALPFFVSTPRFSVLQENQLYFWLYASNIGLLTAGREAMDSDVASPAIYWSLAVEEHFYLIWPAVIFLCDTRTIRVVCLSIIVGAFGVRCVGTLLLGEKSMFFYLTPCRMDGLAAGALVATVLYEQGMAALERLIRPAAIAAAIASAALFVFFLAMKGLWAGHWFIRTVGLSLLVGIFASVLICVLAAPFGALSRALASPPLRFYGKYSYGIYVIHALMMSALLELFPTHKWIAAFGDQTMLGSLSLTFVKVAICTALAVISFHFYEMPFLRMKRYFATRPDRSSVEIMKGLESEAVGQPHFPDDVVTHRRLDGSQFLAGQSAHNSAMHTQTLARLNQL